MKTKTILALFIFMMLAFFYLLGTRTIHGGIELVDQERVEFMTEDFRCWSFPNNGAFGEFELDNSIMVTFNTHLTLDKDDDTIEYVYCD